MDNDAYHLILATLNYYARIGQYQQMQLVASDGLKRHLNDPLLRWINSFTLVMTGDYTSAIREFESLKDKADLGLASFMALVVAHKKCRSVDQDAVREYENRIREDRKQASDRALYNAGLFLFYQGRYDKAREYIDRAYKANPNDKQILAIKGWNDLLSAQEQEMKRAVKFFDDSISVASDAAVSRGRGGTADVDALMGKAKYFELRGNVVAALEMLQSLESLLGSRQVFVPACLERCKLLLAQSPPDWEHMFETVQRLLDSDAGRNCIDAHRFRILHTIAHSGDLPSAADQLERLLELMKRVEPRNALLFYHTGLLFARLCGRNANVLKHATELVSEAVSLEPENVEYLCGLGSVLAMAGPARSKEALRIYSQASKVDNGSAQAMVGSALCHLLDEQFAEARNLLDLVQQVDASGGRSPERLLESAVLARREPGAKLANPGDLLDQAFAVHTGALRALTAGGSPGDADAEPASTARLVATLTGTPASATAASPPAVSPGSLEYLMLLNVDLLLQLVLEYVLLVEAASKNASGGSVDQLYESYLNTASTVIEQVSKWQTGIVYVQYMAARVQALRAQLASEMGGERERALSQALARAQQCVEREPSLADAQLLLASLHLQIGNPRAALQSLETGLGYSFELKDNAQYQLTTARIYRTLGRYPEATSLLQTLLRTSSKGAKAAGGKTTALGASERVSVYLELVECLRLASQEVEATKLLADAQSEFEGTPQAMRVQLATVDMSLQHGDVDGAISTLRDVCAGVPPGSRDYFDARLKLARVYLEHRNDKRRYAACFEELAQNDPSPRNLMALGDAFMSVLEVDKAIEVYEKILKKTPKDAQLAAKIGLAYIRTHKYSKAINYYETALKATPQGAPQTNPLRYDLGNLLFKMKQLDKAERVLLEAVERVGGGRSGTGDAVAVGHVELATLIEGARSMALLARIYEELGRTPDAIRMLKDSRELQGRVLKRVQIEQSDNLVPQKILMAQIEEKLADMILAEGESTFAAESERAAAAREASELEALNQKKKKKGGRRGRDAGDDEEDEETERATDASERERERAFRERLDEAQRLYRDAVSQRGLSTGMSVPLSAQGPAAVHSLEALARLALTSEPPDYAACEKYCNVILQIQPQHNRALLVLGEVAFQKGEVQASLDRFEQMLAKQPDNWLALSRLVDYERRAGHLEDVPRLFSMCERTLGEARANSDSGYHFCKGLYEWYKENAGAALRHLNRARADNEWGQHALYVMIEICLNPANETIGSELFDASAAADGSAPPAAPDKGCASAFQELRRNPGDPRPFVYEQLIKLQSAAAVGGSRGKAAISEAADTLTAVIARHKNEVSAIYALATACMMQKNLPRARNVLKRLIRAPWNAEEAEYLERCWLLLADIYVASNKADLATDLLKRTISHNKSCYKAYEYMALICERAQDFGEAVRYYEFAWRLVNQNDPAIGYKLAFNYIKVRRFFEAIDVGQKILRAQPDYPLVKRQIIEKARLLVRS